MKLVNTCATCTKPIHGRSDKAFCDKACQNQHHKIAREDNFVIQKQEYNRAIKRNFLVLRGLMSIGSSKVIVHRNNLVKQGFDFHHFLDKKKKNGFDIYIIEEFQFRVIGYGKIEVTRIKKGAPYSPEFVDRWSRIFSLNEDCYNVDFEEGSSESFSGDVYYFFERVIQYDEKCLVASATNLLRKQKENEFT